MVTSELDPDAGLLGDSDTESLRSVEIPLDASPTSPVKNIPDHEPAAPEHVAAPPSPTVFLSKASEHPLASQPTETVVPAVPSAVEAAPKSPPPAPSIASTRTSMAPSLASTFASEHESLSSLTSSVSVARKVRPESVVIDPGKSKLILGLAVVDFNHLLGPTVEIAYPEAILEDEEMCKLLPFLALPDGAHLNKEDYSYFHVVPTQPSAFGRPTSSSSPPSTPQTVFGISCNRQIATSSLLSKEADVTRSTVQKAVVVLASKPLFGLIRDKLGVVTRAFFNQRDFRDHSILTEFCDGLETSIRAQLTESGVYMGTSLRELVYTFRHRTLMLLKLIMLQKKVMFYGHPVERLCTYQYSLISLIPGLMLALEDAGAPELAARAPSLKRATEFKSSDRQSLLKFMGLPLDLFGKDAFFQPYMPLQQIDSMSQASYLCGTTNSILTHQRDNIDLIVNIEANTFEFMDPVIERLVSLTPADRRWMDDLLRDVTETWNESDPQRPTSMQFKGSDDYLRVKFEDYLCSMLSALKYSDFLTKSAKGNVTVSGTTGDQNVVQNFGEPFLAAFRNTEAFAVWDRVTDPVIFDIVEPRHPCETKVNAISDLSLRLTEGMHELKIDKNIESTRDAISSVISTGSTSFFKAFEGVRSEVSARMAAQRTNSTSPAPAPAAALAPSPSSSPRPPSTNLPAPPPMERRTSNYTLSPPQPVGGGGLRPLSLGVGLRRTPTNPPESLSASTSSVPVPPPLMSPTLADTAQAARATLGAWGSGIGSFLSSRAQKISAAAAAAPSPSPSSSLNAPGARTPDSSKSQSRASSIVHVDGGSSSGFMTGNGGSGKHGSGIVTSPLGSPTFSIRDLDKEREEKEKAAAAASAASSSTIRMGM